MKVNAWLLDARRDDPMDRLTRVFLEIRDELLAFLSRRTNRSTAEDLAQEVWLKLHERDNAESWQEPRAVIFTTAANLGTDQYRRQVRSDKLFSHSEELGEQPSEAPNPEAQAEAASELDQLTQALQQLPPQCREAFLLNRVDELTHSEIARRLGISTKTVQRHIERALRVCVEVLK